MIQFPTRVGRYVPVKYSMWIMYLFICWRSLFCFWDLCCKDYMTEVSLFLYRIGYHWLKMCMHMSIESGNYVMDPILILVSIFGALDSLSIVAVSPVVVCSNCRAVLASLAMLLIRRCVYAYPWVEVDGWWDNSHISRGPWIMMEGISLLSPIFDVYAVLLAFMSIFASSFLLSGVMPMEWPTLCLKYGMVRHVWFFFCWSWFLRWRLFILGIIWDRLQESPVKKIFLSKSWAIVCI